MHIRQLPSGNWAVFDLDDYGQEYIRGLALTREEAEQLLASY